MGRSGLTQPGQANCSQTTPDLSGTHFHRHTSYSAWMGCPQTAQRPALWCLDPDAQALTCRAAGMGRRPRHLRGTNCPASRAPAGRRRRTALLPGTTTWQRPASGLRWTETSDVARCRLAVMAAPRWTVPRRRHAPLAQSSLGRPDLRLADARAEPRRKNSSLGFRRETYRRRLAAVETSDLRMSLQNLVAVVLGLAFRNAQALSQTKIRRRHQISPGGRSHHLRFPFWERNSPWACPCPAHGQRGISSDGWQKIRP